MNCKIGAPNTRSAQRHFERQYLAGQVLGAPSCSWESFHDSEVAHRDIEPNLPQIEASSVASLNLWQRSHPFHGKGYGRDWTSRKRPRLALLNRSAGMLPA